jgi:hypothetical protein
VVFVPTEHLSGFWPPVPHLPEEQVSGEPQRLVIQLKSDQGLENGAETKPQPTPGPHRQRSDPCPPSENCPGAQPSPRGRHKA